MKKGLIATFMVALMLITVLSAMVSVNAISIDEKIAVSTNTEPATSLNAAFMSGRIENLWEDDYEKYFNCIDVRIISVIPLRFYHFTSGEKLYMGCILEEVFPFFGILTDNFIFGFGQIGWID